MQKEFITTPNAYYQPAAQQETIQRLFYFSKTYNKAAGTIEKDALVYLPYGYDTEDRDYNVFYLMHGGGGNSDEVFGGSEATWNVFAKCLNEFQYFLPMSGDCWAVRMQGGLACPKETVEYLEQSVRKFGEQGQNYRLFVCVGDDGVAYEPLNTMMQEMKNHTDYFNFGKDFSEGNVIYCVAEGGTHSYEYCYQYIYNALPYFFKD